MDSNVPETDNAPSSTEPVTEDTSIPQGAPRRAKKAKPELAPEPFPAPHPTPGVAPPAEGSVPESAVRALLNEAEELCLFWGGETGNKLRDLICKARDLL